VNEEIVFVKTAARLHFGVLDLRGSRGRWFGGIGAAAPAPTLLVSARPADTLDVRGEAADRAEVFARRFLACHGITGAARLCIHRTLPEHAGLGSGTQLALAVARALAEMHRLPTDAPSLARAVGRAGRSAIGTWTFAGGGLVVEGGRRTNQPDPPDRTHGGSHAADLIAPLIARVAFPASWRCVLAVPDADPGISGAAEDIAFTQLPPPPEREIERVAHLVLSGLLPSVADADLSAFGSALSEIQEINGRWFAAIQGGVFAPGPSGDIVRRMREWGAAGVGQSSWGPAVYGIVDGEDAGIGLAERVRGMLGTRGTVHEGAFRAAGARVSRTRVSSFTAQASSVDRD